VSFNALDRLILESSRGIDAPKGNSASFIERYGKSSEFYLTTQLMRKTYVGIKQEIDTWLRTKKTSEENKSEFIVPTSV
jgi:hypothetical protein